MKIMTKLDQFKELLKITTDSLTREEFTSAFKQVLDFCKKAVQDLTQKYQQVISRTEVEISSKLNSLEEKVNYKLSQVKNGKDGKQGEKGRDGRDGKDADETEIVARASTIALDALKPLIPSIDQIEKDLPKLGESIRDALELLQGDDRLDISAIKGLKELLKGQKTVFTGGYVSGGHIVKAHDISGDLNGVLKTFSLPAFYRVISVTSSSFPFTFRPTVDYTTDASAMTLTFTSEITASTMLPKGQTILVTYSEL